MENPTFFLLMAPMLARRCRAEFVTDQTRQVAEEDSEMGGMGVWMGIIALFMMLFGGSFFGIGMQG